MAAKKTPPQERIREMLDDLRSRFARGAGAGSSRTPQKGRKADSAPLLGLPAQIRSLLDDLPQGTGEIAAVLLIVFGVVSLLALLNFSPEQAASNSWAQSIRRLFGYGSFVVALGILALGVSIVLPQFGVELRFPWSRILAIEVTFLSFLALLHLVANDPEPRALARAGGGGGYVGWAFSQLIAGFLDPITASLVYGLIFLLAIGQAAGLRRQHIRMAIDWAIQRLHDTAQKLEQRAEHLDQEVEVATLPSAEGDPEIYQRRWRPSVVDRSPNVSGAEPHVRPVSRKGLDEDALADATGFDDEDFDDELDLMPGDVPHYIQPESGRLDRGLSSPGIPGERPSIVPRNDGTQNRPSVVFEKSPLASKFRKVRDSEGRIVREFRVEDLEEPKRIGNRDDNLPEYELLKDNTLDRPNNEEINNNARIIEETLREFDIHVEVVDVKIGPAVTQYAVQPFKETITEDGQHVLQRVRVGRITTLENDLALALSAKRLRIQAPVPGHSYVGVEVPNKKPSLVSLRGVMESAVFYKYRDKPLAIPLGRDVSGASFVVDLATMPHLLIAGTTGSGKSVALTALATSLVMNNFPDRLRIVMLDPKMVELTRFNGLPHLLGPVEVEQERIIGVLRWATREMDRRYKLLEVAAARNIEAYNRSLGRRRKDEHLPYIVILFDEIGDLMLSRPDETEKMLARLAQMARAVGIHLVVATQRPSVDVITGLIKANFPARISFAVASGIDSRVILDTVGAETLMGRGDMLYQAADAAGPQRLQGCYVSDEELDQVLEHWSRWMETEAEASGHDARTLAPWERGMTRREVLSETDPMLEEAIQIVLEAGEASASLIQRRMGVGYPRAARLMDLLQELGIIGAPTSGGRTREVLYKAGDDPFRRIIDRRIQHSDDQ
ncbi:MAG: DNA translocase FtsK [Anaerolineae bacterium]|nr:DNA translocase FtsK [Anaerolineae bacterium]